MDELKTERKPLTGTVSDDLTMPGRSRARSNFNNFDVVSEELTMPGRRKLRRSGNFLPGEVILRRYKVISELGRGGMGVVYRCFDEISGVEVAMKMLQVELAENSAEMEDIRENFQLVYKLHHPNIAASNTLEYDSVNGVLFLVMECVEGIDLRRWLKTKRNEGKITLDTILPILRQIAAALDFAHEQNILHRDIKPGNVMISEDGNIKVLDFGLAVQIRTNVTNVSVLHEETSGTAPYMAPEQWRGYAPTAAVDQYALAVLTYEALTGHLPFSNPDIAILREAVLKEEPEQINDIPPYASAALQKALSKNRDERFKTCSEFIKALSPAPPQRLPLKKMFFATLAILLILTGLAINGYIWRGPALSPKDKKSLEEWKNNQKEREKLQKTIDRLNADIGKTKSQNSSQIAELKKQLAALKNKEQGLISQLQKSQNSQLKKVVELYADVAAKKELLLKKNYDGNYACELHAAKLKELINSGESARDKNELQNALTFFQQASQEIDWLEENAPKREKTAKVLPRLRKQQNTAKNINASKFARELLLQSEESYQKGYEAYNAGNFDIAHDHFRQSLKFYSETINASKNTLLDMINNAKSQKRWKQIKIYAERLKNADPSRASKIIADADKEIQKETLSKLQEQMQKAVSEKKWNNAFETAQKILNLHPNHAEALLICGRCCIESKGVLGTYFQAVEYFKRSAVNGSVDACFYLGEYFSGKYGTAQNKTEAYKWYEEAAHKGHSLSQYIFAQQLRKLNRNPEEVFSWFLKSAKQGNADAQLQLAKCCEQGYGTTPDWNQALKWYKEAAKNNQPQAQLVLGRCYNEKIGVSKDDTVAAFKLFQKSANAGNIDAAYELSRCYETGKGTVKDLSQAMKWRHKAADAGNVQAQLAMGKYYSNEKNKEKAFKWYSRAAAGGAAEASYHIAAFYETETFANKDENKAFQHYLAAAKQGIPAAQKKVGDLYSTGIGTAADDTQAFYWYKEAASKGLASAQKRLGDCFLDGKGCPASFATAWEWYQKAALNNSPEAVNILGNMHMKGEHVQKDEKKAFNYYQKAAEMELPDALYNLGNCYFSGKGTAQDKNKAFVYYKKAAEQGCSDAQFILGICYQEGHGCRKNQKTAFTWFCKAADQKHEKALLAAAECYLNGRGTAKNIDFALTMYQKAAEKNSPEACFVLGKFHLEGKYTAKDVPQGIKLLRSASAANHIGAQLILADCYLNGNGVNKDYLKAVNLYKNAIEKTNHKTLPNYISYQDHVKAHCVLADYYSNGKYTKANWKQAVHHLRCAAELNDGQSQLRLADYYAAQKQHETALVWYNKAAEKNIISAQYKLACHLLSNTKNKRNIQKAVSMLKKAADNSFTPALIDLGKLYYQGKAVNQNYIYAFTYFSKAAEKKDCPGEVYYWLGKCCFSGYGTRPSEPRAFKYFSMAANKGVVEAQYELADFYRLGYGISAPDLDKAIFWYEKAAKNGHPDALYKLADLYIKSDGINHNLQKAETLLKQSADAGNINAQYRLGQLYEQKANEPGALNNAVHWYHKAASNRNAAKNEENRKLKAQIYYHLALCLVKNQNNGIAVNYAEAAKWMNKAAAEGIVDAQYSMGMFYYNGLGVNKDPHKAVEWYNKAAIQGNLPALSALGLCHLRGIGVELNAKKAVVYFKKAAVQNYGLAQFYLGWCYDNGLGVESNPSEALKWYTKANDNGIPQAAKEIARLEQSLL